MTPNLSSNYGHWAAGAAVVLMLVSYAFAWVGAAIVGLVLAFVFESIAWIAAYAKDDE